MRGGYSTPETLVSEEILHNSQFGGQGRFCFLAAINLNTFLGHRMCTYFSHFCLVSAIFANFIFKPVVFRSFISPTYLRAEAPLLEAGACGGFKLMLPSWRQTRSTDNVGVELDYLHLARQRVNGYKAA